MTQEQLDSLQRRADERRGKPGYHALLQRLAILAQLLPHHGVAGVSEALDLMTAKYGALVSRYFMEAAE